jgi:two-component system, cell cycle sensor histidine kinase and response regulator CckA
LVQDCEIANCMNTMIHHPIKILVVEDNPGDVLLLQESFSEIPLVEFDLVPVGYLRDALTCLQSERFDVILLDLVLPDSEGLATFTQLYNQAPMTPIVVLTGMADETLAIRALQAGAQDYLVKGQVSSSELLLRSIRYAIERKRIEAALHQREQEFRTLADNAPDIIARFDQNLRHLYVNVAVEKAIGLSVQDVLGKTDRELGMPEPQVNQWEVALKRVFKTGEQVTLSLESPTPNGMKYYQSRCVPEFALDGAVTSVLGITRDLTEQKQLETQFLRAQRLESLGTLASGIAHDMNNILAPMLASAQLLPILVPNLDEQSQQLLKIFEDNTRRGTELVKQILTFARGLEGERTPVQVKHILVELAQIIKSTFPKSIEMVRTFSKQDLWVVSANATQLHQVFMNLCVNARDAMPNGGVLSISAENKVIDEIYARMHLDAKAGPYLAITFGDTGTGISPEHLDRIFEPFYTTKPLGKGTGLGLSSAIGIVKNHGGFLTVNSEMSIGTQFQILLPAIGETEILPEEVPKLPLGQGEYVLVVDDEVSIRETLKITLETQNYKVLTAKDGLEAIASYAQHRNDIKAVLLDLMMPLMDGPTAIQVLQQINPQVKIIACSGVATRESLPSNATVQAFLPKPFTSEDLFSALHDVLIDRC